MSEVWTEHTAKCNETRMYEAAIQYSETWVLMVGGMEGRGRGQKALSQEK